MNSVITCVEDSIHHYYEQLPEDTLDIACGLGGFIGTVTLYVSRDPMFALQKGAFATLATTIAAWVSPLFAKLSSSPQKHNFVSSLLLRSFTVICVRAIAFSLGREHLLITSPTILPYVIIANVVMAMVQHYRYSDMCPIIFN